MSDRKQNTKHEHGASLKRPTAVSDQFRFLKDEELETSSKMSETTKCE